MSVHCITIYLKVSRITWILDYDELNQSNPSTQPDSNVFKIYNNYYDDVKCIIFIKCEQNNR